MAIDDDPALGARFDQLEAHLRYLGERLARWDDSHARLERLARDLLERARELDYDPTARDRAAELREIARRVVAIMGGKPD